MAIIDPKEDSWHNLVEPQKEDERFTAQIVKLWNEDPDSRPLLKARVLDYLANNPYPSRLPLHIQCQSLFSRANFANSEDEKDEVAAMFVKRAADPFPVFGEHRGLEFSERYLVAESMFEKHFARLKQIYEILRPGLFRELTVAGFEEARKWGISAHLDDWIAYARDRLCPVNLSLF